jgi:hypothetical protein
MPQVQKTSPVITSTESTPPHNEENVLLTKVVADTNTTDTNNIKLSNTEVEQTVTSTKVSYKYLY